MRFLLTILFCYSVVAQAQSVYHVSNSGSDGNSGTSALPFLTINHALSVAVTGDSILLNRGNVFNEALTIATNVKFNAYGAGANPIISGYGNVTGFTNVGNIWSATASNAVNGLNLVVLNGSIAYKGRYPNTGWLTFTSYSGDSSITGTLTGNHSGFGIAVRTVPWIIDVTKITSQIGGTLKLFPKITYTPAYGGNGYFLQDVSLIDTVGEYAYNDTTKLLTVYSTSTPTVKIATIDTLVKIQVNGVSFSNIQIEGANKILVYSNNSGLNFTQCKLIGSGADGINGLISASTFSTDTIQNILNNGLTVSSGYTMSNNNSITDCYFKNIGFIAGMGGNGNAQYNAIGLYGNSTLIKYNTFDSVGYIPVFFSGRNVNVLYNDINNYCFVKSDGAAIYSAIGVDSTTLANLSDSGTVIKGNITDNGIGAPLGTTNGVGMNNAAGVYLDENVSHVLVDSNSISNPFQAGIIFHDVAYNTATNNNIYSGNNSYAFVLAGAASVTNNNTFKFNNIFISNGQGGTYRDYFDNQENIDSNYFSRWPTEGNFMYNQGTPQSLTAWAGATHFDLHSKPTPVDVTYDPVLYYSNPTKSSITINIGQTYKDFYGNSANSFTLAPFQSIILFKALNQIIPVVPPNRTIPYLHIRIRSL